MIDFELLEDARKQEVEEIMMDIKEDNTLVILEETEKINIINIDYDLTLFIEALEKLTKKEYTIISDANGQFITEYKR